MLAFVSSGGYSCWMFPETAGLSLESEDGGSGMALVLKDSQKYADIPSEIRLKKASKRSL